MSTNSQDSESIDLEDLAPFQRVLGYAVVEYADVADDSLHLSIWLRGAKEPELDYKLRVLTSTGRELFSTTAQTQDRVLADGRFERKALNYKVPIASLRNGSLRLELTSVNANETRPLRPSPGLLASSRPRHLDGSIRYQFFPGAFMRFGRKGIKVFPRVRLRVGEVNIWGRFTWGMRNFFLDLAFLLYGRKFAFARLNRFFTRRSVGEGPIWLIGERNETARDNGVRFFEYLRREHPELRAYYIIDEDSPMLGNVLPLGNVVFHSSKEHRRLMHHADVLANAYSIKHMVPKQWNPTDYGSHFAWRIGSRRVYLKHGVHDKTTMFKRGTNGFDLVVTVGPAEGEAFETDSGYTSTQLKEVGLPRYDILVREPGHRTILMMLTWRRYFVPKLFGNTDEIQMLFEGSRYEKFLQDFFSSERLKKVLDNHDLNLVMVPHYNMAKEAENIPLISNRIQVLDGATADIPTLLRQCDLLITDYSSVHFDVGYLGTPVIYSRFDREEYQAGHASESWFSYEDDGFGPVVENVDATIDALEKFADQDFENSPQYMERVDSIFTFRDKENCQRLFSAIEAFEVTDADVR